MQKTCRHCLLSLPKEKFHKDKKNKDGLSARCAQCRNASKKKKIPEPTLSTFKIPIHHETPDSNLALTLDAIYQRHRRFFTFQVSSNKVILTFHGDPQLTIKGTAEKVIAEALR